MEHIFYGALILSFGVFLGAAIADSPHKGKNLGKEIHTDQTLRKVYEGLLAAGVEDAQAVDAVSQMLNQGILFRERG